MRTITLFAIFAAVTFPLSGCLGGTVGGASAQDTTTETESSVMYKYLTFDAESENDQWATTLNVSYLGRSSDRVLLDTFNTTAGNLFSVVYGAPACQQQSSWTIEDYDQQCALFVRSTCGDIVFPPVGLGTYSETSSTMLLGTADSDCMHQVLSAQTTATLAEFEVTRLYYEMGFVRIPIVPH